MYNSATVSVFSFASQTWGACTPIASGSVQVAGALAYFPDRDSLVWLDGDWGVWELSVASSCTGGWTHLASTNVNNFSPNLSGLSSYHNISEYSGKCHCVVLGGDGTTFYSYNSNGAFASLATFPAEIGIPQQSSGSIFTVDPVSGNFLAWTGSGTGRVYDPSADSWSMTGIASPDFPGTRRWRNRNRGHPDPRLRCRYVRSGW